MKLGENIKILFIFFLIKKCVNFEDFSFTENSQISDKIDEGLKNSEYITEDSQDLQNTDEGSTNLENNEEGSTNLENNEEGSKNIEKTDKGIQNLKKINASSSQELEEKIMHLSSLFGVEDFINDKNFEKAKQDRTKEIFQKFDAIRDFKTFACQSNEDNFEINLRIKIERLFYDLRKYFEIKDDAMRIKIENNLKNICPSESEGVGKIYSFLKYFLEYKQIKYYIKNCTQYKASEVETWSKNVKKISTMFTFIVISCEQIFQSKSGFNLTKFVNEINSLNEYYVEEGFFEEFQQSNKSVGLNQIWSQFYNLEKDKSLPSLVKIPSFNAFIDNQSFPSLFRKIWKKNLENFNQNYYVFREYQDPSYENVVFFNFFENKFEYKSWLPNKQAPELKKNSTFINIKLMDTYQSERYTTVFNILGVEERNNVKFYKNYHGFDTKDGGEYSTEDCWKKCNEDKNCLAFSVSRSKKKSNQWALKSCFLYGNGTRFEAKLS
jgi:hypothetical protein